MEYKDWFSKMYNEQGALITQAQAAKILNLTRSRIRQLINDKKLETFTYENDAPLVLYRSVLLYLNRK